jgi:hypothetical protein
MVGNCYIRIANILILRKTNESGRTMLKPSSNRVFTPSGLKVIFQLLDGHNAIKLNYRDLAKNAGVSIDTISKVCKDLLLSSIILKKNEKKLIIIDRHKLSDNWVQRYNEKLGLICHNTNLRIKKCFHIKYINAGLIGCVSATNFWNRNELIVENYMIYTSNDIKQVARDLKLIPDNKGNVVRRFSFLQ